MRALLYAGLAILATGCANKGIGPSKHIPQVRQDLPVVKGIKTLPDTKAVGLEWKMAPAPDVHGYYLYRAVAGGQNTKLQRVAKIDDPYASHYVDKALKPATEYVYQMSTYDEDGDESRQSAAVRVRTMPPVGPVSFVRAITNLPKRIKVIWRPHNDLRVVGYVIERATVKNHDTWKKRKEIANRLSAEFIDKELGSGDVYIYRVRAKLCDKSLTAPSEAVKAITKPLPKPPFDVLVSSNLPRRIHVEWKPSPTPDVVYYKVYRSPFASGFYKYRAKVKTTVYDDHVSESGKIYYYKITAVDKDGLESPMLDAPSIGKTLERPVPPTIISSGLRNGKPMIQWSVNDHRAIKFRVVRTYWSGLTKKKRSFENIHGRQFVDSTALPGIKYTYIVKAIDNHKIESHDSNKVEIFVPKADGSR